MRCIYCRRRRKHSRGDSDEVVPSTSSDKPARRRCSSEKRADQHAPLISDPEDETNNENEVCNTQQPTVAETPRCRTRRSGSANAKPENLNNEGRDIKQELEEEYNNSEKKTNEEDNKESLLCLRSRNSHGHGSSEKTPVSTDSVSVIIPTYTIISPINCVLFYVRYVQCRMYEIYSFLEKGCSCKSVDPKVVL